MEYKLYLTIKILHYKWAHPWAELNGPQKTNLNDGYELITRKLGFKTLRSTCKLLNSLA